jgi:hypothetical protein
MPRVGIREEYQKFTDMTQKTVKNSPLLHKDTSSAFKIFGNGGEVNYLYFI